MPTYISLIRYTQQGINSAKDGPKRLDAAKEAYKKAGGELKSFYLTMGQYDMVAISEFPSDDVAARAALALAAGILVLWGVTLWTAIGVALLLVCPAIIVWAMLDLARDEARDQRLDEIRRKQKP